MSTINDSEVMIKTTCNYGKINENSRSYDVCDEIGGENLLNYKIYKIICQIKSNESIRGIKFIYRNINDGKEVTLINVKSKEFDLIEQEMTFTLEDIIDLRAWVSDNISLIGFEVTTNKGRSQKFGYGNDEELRKLK